jgi:hypothetical protein
MIGWCVWATSLADRSSRVEFFEISWTSPSMIMLLSPYVMDHEPEAVRMRCKQIDKTWHH